MAQENLTKAANIDVTAREIDFVTRFQQNWTALMAILGVTRMIKMTPGTILTSKKAKVTLADGAVGEGEPIPYSLAEVEEVPYDEIDVEKYCKAVSLEAIKKWGYDTAVRMTDEAFMNKLTKNVQTRFYETLNTFGEGSELATTADTWQMALAKARGQVLNFHDKMDIDITEVVAFANIEDYFEYLGSANITTQTAYGITYIKDFMGYRTIILLSEDKIKRGRVIAIAKENLVDYFVSPSDSDFARAGLRFTTSGVTPFIGYHVQPNYNTMVTENYALMGMLLFVEYSNAIACVDMTSVAGTSVTGRATTTAAKTTTTTAKD